MKTRSKPLYEYLLAAGMLGASEEAIAEARRQYRRDYKKRWKKERTRHKEIRIALTLRQFNDVKVKAYCMNLRHTPYARAVLLSATEGKALIANRDILLKILQIVSMSAIAAKRNSVSVWQLADQMEQAERMLLEYLQEGVT